MQSKEPQVFNWDKYKELKFWKAENFISKLGRTSEYWQPFTKTTNQYEFPTYIFRGHGIKSWKLVPSVLRENNLKSTLSEQLNYESYLLSDFYHICQIYGLPVAEDSQELKRHFGFNKKWWPPCKLYSLCAHAQHYGVPTRLLDWSWDPLIAMYFAAKSAIEKKKQDYNHDRIAIWALDTSLLAKDKNLQERPIEIVTAPAAQIPNLAAQKGIFTLIREKYLNDNQGINCYPLEEHISDYAELVKATLPYCEVKRLFYLLSREFVTAASVYPGYEGVVEYLLREAREEYYDIPDKLIDNFI